LGRGGMAEVWLAEQTSLKRQVAVKILRPEFVTNASYLKRFRHEATAAGSLNHPNIVQVYLVGEQDGIHYIAQEYVQGRNLKDFIVRKGALEVPIALHILRQVAAALQVAASSGIVHRDIKPENVILTKKAEAKVADFGLAQLSLQGEKVALTQVGVTMGTPLYMSPEQVSGKTLDARSDLYSLGIMAWYMLAGRPPFSGESALAVAVKHLNDPPPSLLEVRSDIPKPLADLIDRLMAKNKEERPIDAQAVGNELRSILRQMTGKEAAPAETATNTRPIRRAQSSSFLTQPMSRQLRLMAAVSLVIMAGSAAVGWAMRTPDPFLKPATKPDGSSFPPALDALTMLAETNSEKAEAAWIAVKKHKDASNRETSRADINLAMIYLKTNRKDLAVKIFDDFASSTEPWKKIHARAGQIILKGLTNFDSPNPKGLANEAKNLLESPEAQNLIPPLEGPVEDALQDLITRSERATNQ